MVIVDLWQGCAPCDLISQTNWKNAVQTGGENDHAAFKTKWFIYKQTNCFTEIINVKLSPLKSNHVK